MSCIQLLQKFESLLKVHCSSKTSPSRPSLGWFGKVCLYVKMKYVKIFTQTKVNTVGGSLNQIKCVLTTNSLSQSEENKIQKPVTARQITTRTFFCKITKESSQPCSFILFHALTNTNVLNYKTDSFLMKTKSKSLVFNLLLQSRRKIFRLAPIRENRFNEAIAFPFQYIYFDFSLV